MLSIATLDSTFSNSTVAAWANTRSFSAAIKRRYIGTKSFARLWIEVKHVAAAIELELHAAWRLERRHVVEDITRHGVGGDHVGIPVRDHQAK